jgi:predicted RND superfamily exporter protein
VGGWAALLVIAALGASRLSFSHDSISWFPKGHHIRTATELANSELRGALFLELLIETGEENGLHAPQLLERMERIAEHAESLRSGDVYIGKTVSLADVVKEIHQALNENRPEFHAVPDDRELVAQELLLFENSGSDDLEDFVDSRFSSGRLTMRIPFCDAAQYPALFDDLERGVEHILGPDFEFQLTGLGSIAGRMLPAVMQTMAKSYAIALAVITPLMVLLIGSLRIGLMSMIPNLAPILLTLGLMGWTGIPLDSFTLMVGSIAIGLAVDDTIHFLHNFRRYYGRSGDVPEAVRETLASTGQALLFTSLVLSSGFFLYMLASMNNLFYFGLLTGFTIIAAFLADLILAPALMALVMRKRGVAVAGTLKMEASR